jgi:hypothetical protein
MLNFFKNSSNTERFKAVFSPPKTVVSAYISPKGAVKTMKDCQINFRTDKITKSILERTAKEKGLAVSALIHSVLSAQVTALLSVVNLATINLSTGVKAVLGVTLKS